MGRPINPTRHERYNKSWDTRFEQVFSPMEFEIRRKLNAVRASQRYRLRHPDRYLATLPKRLAYNRKWHPEHPDAHRKSRQRQVKMMTRGYMIQLLRQQARPVTEESIAEKRAELRARRSLHAFRSLAGLSAITKILK